jgi:CrcB protein
VIVVLVVACAGLGAVARFAVDAAVESRTDRLGELPFGTLVVNISGSFILGVLAGLGAPHRTMLVLGTAAVGSYTTFSTWMLETERPAEDGDRRLAWGNVIVSLIVGLGAVALGRAVGRAL